jgi:hypothetical protein
VLGGDDAMRSRFSATLRARATDVAVDTSCISQKSSHHCGSRYRRELCQIGCSLRIETAPFLRHGTQQPGLRCNSVLMCNSGEPFSVLAIFGMFLNSYRLVPSFKSCHHCFRDENPLNA